MKRPILVVAIGYVIGIIEGLYFKFSIVFFYILIATIYLIVKAIPYKNIPIIWNHTRYIRYIKIYVNRKAIILLVTTSILSNLIIFYQENQYEKIQTQLQHEDIIQMTGIIKSNPIIKENNVRYKMKIHNIILKNKIIKIKNRKIYISVKNKEKLEYGQNIRISGNFIMPEQSRNYGGFDNKQYLKTQKIIGNIKVANIQKLANKNNDILFLINKQANNISNNIKEKIKLVFPLNTATDKNNKQNNQTAGILIALLLGDTQYISEEIINSFRNANISHILAVSGMHMSYIIFCIKFCFTKISGKQKALIITIIMLIIYMFITGFSVSIVRAGVMGIILILSKLIYTHNDTYTNISISALIILLSNPYAILSLSFQLSFGGTLGIILFHKFINIIVQRFIKGKIGEMLSVTLSAQIIILPISICHFNTINIYFLFTNILTGIVIGPIMVSSIIFLISILIHIKIAEIISVIPTICIQILLNISQISKLPLSTIYIATPKLWQIIIYFAIIVIVCFLYKLYFAKNITNTIKRFRNLIAADKFYICYRNPKKVKTIGFIIIILALCSIATWYIVPHGLYIHFVDVGQGDCTFIETPQRKTILIDGGGKSTYDVGKNTLLPYILDRGYTKIDFVILSHFDIDHVRFDPIFITRNKSRKCDNRKTI